jgi:nucleoside-diphosphate-sugar epimerase
VFGGSQCRPFVHVTDVARAIVRCVEAPLSVVRGQTYNVGSDAHNYTLREVGRLVCSLVPEAKRVRYDPGEDRRNYRVSFAKIERELGFTCKVGLEEGILELAAALRNGTIGDYTSARYSNHKTLSDPTGQPRLRRRGEEELLAQIREAVSGP